ncbi:MAG: N-acetylglucosamine-6-phosphate deacetylase [Chloroflexia bacterium]|nr:N-acetylglucosamine-6-phosphate deacetylase [Chloroflexia bacterium]
MVDRNDSRPSSERVFAVRGALVIEKKLTPGALVVEDGRIAAIHRGTIRDDELPSSIIEADIVSPGLIDLQVNGGFGYEVGANPTAIDRLSAALATTGVTAYLPTFITAPADVYPGVFAAFERVDHRAGAIPLGLHLEGPFIAPARKGAHQLRSIEAADDALFGSWLAVESIRLVTLAPERIGALDRIWRLVERGIVVSLGHTDSTFEQFITGVDAGANMATHLFNAMTPIHHRAPGPMVAAMTDQRVTAGLIPDGVHSHVATVQLALNAMGPDRIAIVTDMMAAAGLGPGTYALGGQRVTVDEQSARLDDGTLAGSIVTMDQAVRNIVAWTDVGIATALHMCTAVPGRVLGLATKGHFYLGADADLTLFDLHLQVQHTIVSGRFVYSEGDE